MRTALAHAIRRIDAQVVRFVRTGQCAFAFQRAELQRERVARTRLRLARRAAALGSTIAVVVVVVRCALCVAMFVKQTGDVNELQTFRRHIARAHLAPIALPLLPFVYTAHKT